MSLQFKNRMQSLLLLLIFLVMGVLAFFPFYTLLLASFKPATEMLRNGLNISLEPEVLNFNNYKYLFTEEGNKYFVWYKNTIILTAAGTVLTLVFSSFVGYGLAVYQFRGRNIIFIMVLAVLMIPTEVIMLPLYRLAVWLKIINTFTGVILPGVVTPIAIFFFRQYASGLPRELIDAGRIDGASEYGIFFRIMAPLMAPAYGAMAILMGLGNWNNFIWPLIVLRTDDKFNLSIGLSSLLTPYGNNYDILLSGSILSILPILILFIFFQRYFISGLTVGGVKG